MPQLKISRISSDEELKMAVDTAGSWNKYAMDAIEELIQTENPNSETIRHLANSAGVSEFIHQYGTTLIRTVRQEGYIASDLTDKQEIQGIMILFITPDEVEIQDIVAKPYNPLSADAPPCKGIGRALVEKAKESAREKNKNRISVKSLPSSIGFYEKLEFQQVPSEEEDTSGLQKLRLSLDPISKVFQERIPSPRAA